MKGFAKSTMAISATLFLSACATQPDELGTTYVSSSKYQDFDCRKIESEMEYVSNRTVDLYQTLDKKADNDAVAMGVGLILFWPALFMLDGGDGPEAAEYSRLKGDFKALQNASDEKHCKFVAPRAPEEIIKEKSEQEKAKKQQTSSGGVH